MRKANFPLDTPILSRLYDRVAYEHGLITVQRSDSYWNEYLSVELGETLWVLLDKDGLILGSLALKEKNNVTIISECTWEENLAKTTLEYLLPLCLDAAKQNEQDGLELKLPTFLFRQVESLSYLSSPLTEDDEGWMFRGIQAGSSIPTCLLYTSPSPRDS